MKIPVTGPVCWTPHEGVYEGVIEYAGPYKDAKTQARIIVALKNDDGSGFEYKVHRVYPAQLYPGSDLHNDIEAIMGKGYLSRTREFDLEHLVGKEVVVNVAHIKSSNYRKPLVTFDAIRSARGRVVNPFYEKDDFKPTSPIEANLNRRMFNEET